jgi:hypothetical protein
VYRLSQPFATDNVHPSSMKGCERRSAKGKSRSVGTASRRHTIPCLAWT